VTKSAQEVLEFEREFTLLEERQRIVWVGQLEAPVSLAAAMAFQMTNNLVRGILCGLTTAISFIGKKNTFVWNNSGGKQQ